MDLPQLCDCMGSFVLVGTANVLFVSCLSIVRLDISWLFLLHYKEVLLGDNNDYPSTGLSFHSVLWLLSYSSVILSGKVVTIFQETPWAFLSNADLVKGIQPLHQIRNKFGKKSWFF